MGGDDVLSELDAVSQSVEERFKRDRRVLSFREYLELFQGDPVRHTRDAARYLRDMFDHFGRTVVERPWGAMTRFKLFDLPWIEQAREGRDALIGQEAVQAELYRELENFAREGAPRRVLMLHGPNGSAKSTVAACIMRGLERYSLLDEGALYRFHWVFPTAKKLRGAIGFAERGAPVDAAEDSYAHLADTELDARLYVEVRDHPLFLLPATERADFLRRLYVELGEREPPPAWLLHGSLSHKSRQVYEALLGSYGGSLKEVLRHVQLVRTFISRRDRVGAVTLGPQLSVDASERQLTADRSIATLPASLQSVPLFEAHGELVDAAGGLLEFSDLLKRPLDAYKYLQITAETGEVALGSQNIQLNCVMLASANELHLAAFREHPEFESFRGRLTMIQSPYLRSWRDERGVYDSRVVPQLACRVAPHATTVAAMFAVLTRLLRPELERYPESARELIAGLTVEEKLDLYADGTAPERLPEDQQKTLRALIESLYRETRSEPAYEGRGGASPREMQTLLLDAAQSPYYASLSPFAVLDALDRLCERVTEFAWLNADPEPGGYHDHRHFRRVLRTRLLDLVEDELRVASGLVDATRYAELFSRYITHVSQWLKGERIPNPVTRQLEEPDERMLAEVEALLGATGDLRANREALMSRVAAWVIDHPAEAVEPARIFRAELARMRDRVFAERRKALARLAADLVVEVREDGAGLTPERRAAAQAALERLTVQFGHDRRSAADAASALVKERFQLPPEPG